MRLKKILVITAVVLTVFVVFTFGYVSNVKAGIADNILRLHIVGASNSESDQALKLCVRDRLLNEFSDIFEDCKSLGEAKAAAEEHRTELEAAAEDELRRRGCDYSVTAEVGVCRFPTKTYGNIALPGGRYTALNVKIGEAEGRNWWCVMYPPLCVTDKTVVMSEESAERLKNCLTAEEYALISESGEPNIKIKFKIAEILGKCFR